jgi:hypothetical protein
MDEDQPNALLLEEITQTISICDGEAGIELGGSLTPQNNTAEQWTKTLKKIVNSVVVLKVVSRTNFTKLLVAAATPPPLTLNWSFLQC